MYWAELGCGLGSGFGLVEIRGCSWQPERGGTDDAGEGGNAKFVHSFSCQPKLRHQVLRREDDKHHIVSYLCLEHRGILLNMPRGGSLCRYIRSLAVDTTDGWGRWEDKHDRTLDLG